MGKAGTGQAAKIGNWSLRKKPDSPFWHAVHYDQTTRSRSWRSLGITDFQQAHRRLASLAADEPERVEKGAQFAYVNTALDWYYENHAKTLPSAPSARSSIAIWKKHLGTAKISDLTSIRMERFKTALRKQGKSEGYISRILRVGVAAFHLAKVNNKLRDVPSIKDNQTQTDRDEAEPRGRPLTLEEMARLIVVQPQKHMQVFIMIMVSTACRPSAALELTRDQIDFDLGRVYLNPEGRRQTKKHRPAIPMTKSLRELLLKIEQEQFIAAKARGEKNFKFTNYVLFDGQPVKSVKTSWRKMVVRAGFVKCDAKGEIIGREPVTPYSIRHTIGRVLRAARVPTEERSIFMGHKRVGSGRVTAIYSPDDPEYLQEVADVIEDYVKKLSAECARQYAEAHAS